MTNKKSDFCTGATIEQAIAGCQILVKAIKKAGEGQPPLMQQAVMLRGSKQDIIHYNNGDYDKIKLNGI